YRFGETSRVNSPLELCDGDRFQVGEYILVVSLGGAAPAGPFDLGGASAPPPASDDPWAVGGGTPAPVNVEQVVPSSGPRRGIFDEELIETPSTQGAAPSVGGIGAPASNPATAFDAPERHQPQPPSGPFGGGAQPPGPAASGGGPINEGFGVQPQQPPAAAPPQAVEAFIAQICQGAGLPPDVFRGTDTSTLGHEIGRVLRIVTEDTMALLLARAAAKVHVKAGQRTMMGATDNSPLKFLPDATQALDAMFFHKRQGYMDGVAAFSDAMGDVKAHQAGIYAAIQPALARLLEDLSPESVEERVGGGIMGGKKARAWDTYVQRWDAKTHPYENGMLDVFLAYFAEAYDQSTRKSG
ncbi:MAG: type VI secretion system-associated FHA domain protein TagH, partial [Pseudomonadota bacterium]